MATPASPYSHGVHRHRFELAVSYPEYRYGLETFRCAEVQPQPRPDPQLCSRGIDYLCPPPGTLVQLTDRQRGPRDSAVVGRPAVLHSPADQPGAAASGLPVKIGGRTLRTLLHSGLGHRGTGPAAPEQEYPLRRSVEEFRGCGVASNRPHGHSEPFIGAGPRARGSSGGRECLRCH